MKKKRIKTATTHNCNLRLAHSYSSSFQTHHECVCLFAFHMDYYSHRYVILSAMRSIVNLEVNACPNPNKINKTN